MSKFAKNFQLQNGGKYKGCTIEDFDIIESKGKGAYAEVFEAVHIATQDMVALKIYEKSKLLDPLKRNSLIREIHILESMNHPNILKIYDCIDTGNKIIMVTELIKGKSLKTLLEEKENRCLSENEATPLFRQICSAMAYCHSKGISHRDLKLENVLVTPQNYIKIIDFGFSVKLKPEQMCQAFCGTPSYMAPEIITKSEYYPPPTDVWAIGVMLYVALCGIFPFQTKSNKDLYSRITKGLFVLNEKLSLQAKEIISGMLEVDTQKRMGLLDVLQHEFFNRKNEGSLLPPIKSSYS